VDESKRPASPLEDNPAAPPGRAETLPVSPYRKHWASSGAQAYARGDGGVDEAESARHAHAAHHAAHLHHHPSATPSSDVHTLAAPGSMGSDFWRSKLAALHGGYAAAADPAAAREAAAVDSFNLLHALRTRRRPDFGAGARARSSNDSFDVRDAAALGDTFRDAGPNDAPRAREAKEAGGEADTSRMAPSARRLHAALAASARLKVSFLLCTVTFYANLADSLTRSPSHI
jgi:hypothetical protein